MMMQRLLNDKTIDEIAIERLREWEPAALQRNPNGYWVAFSGGKDSVVIYDLVKRAGVKHEVHHSLTTIDPPELVRFVRTFKDVVIDKPPMSFVQLVRKKGMPPRRNARYCCEVLKEQRGQGRIIVTGVRWAESANRSKRRIVEDCYKKKAGTKFLNIIIEWSTEDVWRYVRERGLPYCQLYDEGFDRIGCVLCPMAKTSDVYRCLERFPAICRSIERSVKDTWREGKGVNPFKSTDEYWLWWLDHDAVRRKVDDNQKLMYED